MKKAIIALTAIIAMASCKKENVVTAPAPTPVPAVTKNMTKSVYVWDNGTPETQNYTYDPQGRIATIKDDNRTSTFNFVSATSLVVTAKNNADNSLYRTYECTLNDKGYVAKMIMKNPAGAVTYNYEYTYNADGYLIKQIGTFGNGSSDYELEFTIVNGNPVEIKSSNGGVFNYRGVYTYDNSKLNKTPGGHAGYWQSYTLFGKLTKNLLAEYKSFDASNTVTWHTKNTYDMDADGYPVKQTTNYILQGKQGIETFTYQ
jgi:hypothetical protein